MDTEDYSKAFDKMTYFLSVREHSLKELYTKLSKNYSTDIVDAVLEKAVDKKWISSPEEMAQKVKQMLDNKNKGFMYIQQYLQKKGLPEIERDEEIEFEKACGILNQHFKEIDNLTHEQKHKALRLLKNRGFEHETISKVIYENY